MADRPVTKRAMVRRRSDEMMHLSPHLHELDKLNKEEGLREPDRRWPAAVTYGAARSMNHRLPSIIQVRRTNSGAPASICIVAAKIPVNIGRPPSRQPRET